MSVIGKKISRRFSEPSDKDFLSYMIQEIRLHKGVKPLAFKTCQETPYEFRSLYASMEKQKDGDDDVTHDGYKVCHTLHSSTFSEEWMLNSWMLKMMQDCSEKYPLHLFQTILSKMVVLKIQGSSRPHDSVEEMCYRFL